jgi:heme-degrading monooxygenase HmoA
MPATQSQLGAVRAVLSMVVRPGREREFERIWRESADRASRFPGCLGQSLTCDPQHPQTYTITGDWESPGALRTFEQSEERKALSHSVEPLRESSGKTVLNIVYRV